MYEIEKTVTVKVRPTVHDVAKAFCSFDQAQQADFFNDVAKITNKWDHPFVMQLQSITDCELLKPSGREVMEQIGNYALKA